MKKILLILIALSPISIWAQTGPGGVGNSTNNRLWLRADAGVVSDLSEGTAAFDGQLVEQWQDQSGNSNHVSQTVSGTQWYPTFRTDFVNGRSVVEFDGFRNYLNGNIDAGTGIGADATVFAVGRFENLNQPSGDYDYMVEIGGGFVGSPKNFSISRTASNYPGGADLFYSFDGSSPLTGGTLAGQQWTLFTADFNATTPYFEFYTDGTPMTVTDYGAAFNSNGKIFLGKYGSAGNYLNGQISEVIAFNTGLNLAQRQIVESYLAAKYNLSIANDLFSHDATNGHSYEVFGIGQASDGSTNTSAQGSGILEVSSASALSNGDFLLFGHNGLDVKYSTVDVPASLSIGGQRLSRTWRVDETGDVGTVTLTFHLMGSGLSKPFDLELLIDEDGTFASGATRQTGTWNSELETMTFTGVNLSDGDLLTLGYPSTTVASTDQTGPAGVGNSASNPLWLDAQSGLYTDAGVTAATTHGDIIQQWNDRSGNANHITQATATQRPTLSTSAHGDQNTLELDGSDDYLGGLIDGGLSDNITTLTVCRFDHLNQPNSNWDYVWCLGGGILEDEKNLSLSRNAANYLSQPDAFLTYNSYSNVFGPAITGQTWKLIATRNYTIAPYNDLWFEGTEQTVDNYDGPVTTDGTLDVGRYTRLNTHYHDGQVAEMIVYSEKLGPLQRMLVENYLAAKYDLTIANDLYSFDDRTSTGQHYHGVFGIGRASFFDRHEVARGPGILSVGAQEEMADGEYVLLGHEGGTLTEQATDVPASMGSTGSRLNRTWRVAMTGTPGAVQLTFDLSGVTLVDASKMELIVDQDGVFATDAKRITGTWDAVNQQMTFDRLVLAHGDYFTLGEGELDFTAEVSPESSAEPGKINLTLHGGDGPYEIIWDPANFPTSAEFSTQQTTLASGPFSGATLDLASWTYAQFRAAQTQSIRGGLAPGDYEVEVTDDNGTTITKTLILGYEAELTDLTGATYASGTFAKTAADGWTNMEVKYLNTLGSNEDGWIDFVIPSTTSLVAVGLLPASETDLSYTNFDFAFYLDNDNMRVYEGSLGSSIGSYAAGDRFRIERVGSTITYYKNGASVRTVTASASEEYRFNVSMHTSASEVRQVKVTGRPTHQRILPHEEIDVICGGFAPGQVEFAGPGFDPSGYTFNWSNGMTGPLNSGLIPGAYTVTITHPGGYNSINTFDIDYEVAWSNVQNATIPDPNDNVIQKPLGQGTGWNSLGESLNVLPDGIPGFISFVIDSDYGMSGPASSWWVKYGLRNVATQTDEYELACGKWGSGNAFMLFYRNGAGYYYLGQAYEGDHIKLDVDATGTVTYHRNQVALLQHTPLNTQSDRMVKAEMYAEENAVTKARASFDCSPARTIPWANLKKQPDGSFYNFSEGEIRFKYREKYMTDGTDELDYRIYDLSNNQLAVAGDAALSPQNVGPALAVDFGNNWHALPIHSFSLPNGFYLLEVVDQKGGKSYLKFKY